MAEGSLRRLGSGRWQSRDGRFTIEPQAGTWVVVDGEQTDELGLPLVRGPFRSLHDAREAIELARVAGPVASPLNDRVEEARQRGDERPGRARERRPGRSGAAGSPPTPAQGERKEPAWLAKLDAAEKRRAREMMRALETAGIEDAESIARAEVANGRPELARLAIERRIRGAFETSEDVDVLGQAIVDILTSGRDRELGASWRLVDEMDRPIRSIHVRSHR